MEENLEAFVLKHVKLSFMSVKEDKYGNTNSYLRIVDKKFNDRVKQISKEGYKQAWFFNNGKLLKQILKVKQKYVKLKEKKNNLNYINKHSSICILNFWLNYLCLKIIYYFWLKSQ